MTLEFYDIMAEDVMIYARKKGSEIETTIINEDDVVIFKEIGNQAAWDSLVYFANQILIENERLEKQNG